MILIEKCFKLHLSWFNISFWFWRTILSFADYPQFYFHEEWLMLEYFCCWSDVWFADRCCATCCIVSGKKFDETDAWCRGWSWVVPSTRWPRFVAMMHHRPRRRGCCGWRRATRGEAADPDQSGAPFSFWGRTFVCSRGPCLNSPKGSPNDRGVLCQQPSFPTLAA